MTKFQHKLDQLSIGLLTGTYHRVLPTGEEGWPAQHQYTSWQLLSSSPAVWGLSKYSEQGQIGRKLSTHVWSSLSGTPGSCLAQSLQPLPSTSFSSIYLNRYKTYGFLFFKITRENMCKLQREKKIPIILPLKKQLCKIRSDNLPRYQTPQRKFLK